MSEITKTAMERVQLARHPERPYVLDIIETLFEDFVELHGDRRYADDPALVGGFARLGKFEVAVIGQQKGRDLNQRRHRNFGMSKPEGYRKALRLMQLAEKFGRPVITFVDTPGAYPGIDAEERGQAEAIAYNLREMANLRVPVIVVVIGEGGSGGALALGVGDRVLMLENAVYSVITPEGCAAILWKDAAEAPKAAENLRLTASHLKGFSIIDEIIGEEKEWRVSVETDSEEKGAINQVMKTIEQSLIRHLNDLQKQTIEKILIDRYDKFRRMGFFEEF